MCARYKPGEYEEPQGRALPSRRMPRRTPEPDLFYPEPEPPAEPLPPDEPVGGEPTKPARRRSYWEVPDDTPAADDNNCSTAVKCTVCQEITTAAKAHDFSGEWQKDER